MERRAYTLVGLLLLIAIGYLNWSSSGGDERSGDGDSSGGGGLGFRIPIPWLQPRMGFVGRNGTRFVDLADGSPVYVNGWNSYWMMYSGSRRLVSEMLHRGRAMGMTVCRTWAFNDGTSGPNSLQISPGRFDERVFQALDFVVYEARRNHIRLILSLVNNLDVFGGKSQYVKWAQAAGINVSSTDSFFSDPTIKGYYKDYVKTIVTRKNSYSGIRYYDEPAIFAWELINEPRCESNSSAPLLQAWISEMSSYIKGLDKNHLVTVGLEGFYGPQKKERLRANPGEWAASLGSDFIENSADGNIDFASVHVYPDSWLPKADLEEKVSYLSRWIDSHLNDSEHVLKKPVLFSEVGSLLREQKNGTYDLDILLKIVYDKVYLSAKSGQAGAGALIWQLMVEGMQKYQDQFALVAREHKTTYELIMEQSCRLKTLSRKDLNTSKEIGQSCLGAFP